MQKKFYAAMLVVWLFQTASCAAALSPQGSTGLINTPTADLAIADSIHISAYGFHGGWSRSAAFGAANRWEIGAAHIRNADGAPYTSIQIKYALRREGVLTPGLAAGMEDAFDERERSFYLAASKGLPFGMRLHVGIGSGRYDGVFASLEKRLIPGVRGAFPTTDFIMESDGHRMNYGVRLALRTNLKLQTGLRGSDAFFGISGSF